MIDPTIQAKILGCVLEAMVFVTETAKDSMSGHLQLLINMYRTYPGEFLELMEEFRSLHTALLLDANEDKHNA